MVKGLLYIFIITLSGITSVILLILSLVKKDRTTKRAFLLSGMAAFILAAFILMVFLYKVYSRTKKEVVVQIEKLQASNSDTSQQIKQLISMEPGAFRGKVPYSFYTSYGMYDWWRFPVVYPYSILCIDVKDHGSLVDDSGKSDFNEGGSVVSSSPYFDALIFDRNYLVGRIAPGPFKDEEKSGSYFVFSFADGNHEIVPSVQELHKKLAAIQFNADTSFVSIEEYSLRF